MEWGLSTLIQNGRGQSSIIGLSLLFAIAITGSFAIVLLGSAAFSDTQQQSEIGAAEHAMTQLDSQASQVALGDSETKSIRFGDTGGNYEVDPSAGHVTIVHTNFDGTLQDDGDNIPGTATSGNDDDMVIYESDLGTMIYQNGGYSISYQGGGVWKKGPSGNATVVSPPEFHYRGATLTFPVIRTNQVSGTTASASGSTGIRISTADPTTDIFPTDGNGYPDTDGDGDGYPNSTDGDSDGGPFENPSVNGTIRVDITSEYYRGWAEYFRTRTAGQIETFPGNQTTRIVLVSLGTGIGRFAMPGEGSPIEVRGLRTDGHALDDFQITLRADDSDNANFNNLEWSLYAEDDSGQQKFELHLTRDDTDGSGCNLQFDVSIFYTENGNTDYEGWQVENAFTSTCDPDGDLVLHADFTGSTASTTYEELGSDDVLEQTGSKPQGNNLIDSLTIDEHQADVSWEASTYDEGDGDTEELGHLVKHYFAMMGPNFDLTVLDKSSNSVSESNSAGLMDYGGTGQFVTFLHVTENDITVELD